MRRAIEYLIDWHLLNWELILFGFEKGWSSKQDAIKFAEEQLVSEHYNDNIPLIACAHKAPLSEICALIGEMLETDSNTHSAQSLSDQWRLAHCQALLDSPFTDEKKIDILQELYSEFNYPEEMKSCSIYSNDSIDPLEALCTSVNLLKHHFFSQ